MFPKELQELDRDTVQYMIDEMQDEINEQRAQIEEQSRQLEEKKRQLDEEKQLRRVDLEEKEQLLRRIEELEGTKRR